MQTPFPLDAVLDAVPDGIVVLNARGKVTAANLTARRILGGNLVGHGVEDWPKRCGLLRPDRTAPCGIEELPVLAALSGKTAQDCDLIVARPDLPGELWISMSAAPLAGGAGAVCVLRDLSELKRSEGRWREQARQAEETLRKFARGIEQSPACVVITDVEGRIEYVNPKFTELTGYSLEEVRGQNPSILKSGHTPPEEYRQLWETILAGREWRGEFLNRKKNGELYWEWASISPVTTSEGVITHFIAVKEDITARKRVEEALRQANATLRAVIENSPVAICTLGLDELLTSWNAAAERIFGWRAEEVIGRPLAVVAAENLAQFREALVGVRRGEAVRGLRITGCKKDGARLELELWSAALPEGGEGVGGLLILLDDVTERRWMEEQLRQAQKMEAVGRLAGGVAHDFNNLLTIISGYGELLLSEVEGRLRQDVQAILEGAERASALTRQLLALSRRQASEPRLLDLNGIISGMEKILRRALGEDVALEVFLSPSLWSVRADPGQIEQVLLNLAVNARDAMPRGGRLVIATANSKTAEAAALRLPVGEYVRLTVRDTGEGMEAEACQRIFEPFFSTKPREKGTGLGLAIVYGIVKQVGGEIFVDSRPGEGTVFTIYLPRASGVPRPKVERAVALPAAANRETILLVEDEDGVRRLVHDTLTRNGYTVFQARDGPEALAIWRQHGARVDLLLTDVVMPGMSGPELASRLIAHRPELKVVYISGYTGDAIANHEALQPGAVLIQKPFTARLLLRRLRETLDAPRPRQH